MNASQALLTVLMRYAESHMEKDTVIPKSEVREKQLTFVPVTHAKLEEMFCKSKRCPVYGGYVGDGKLYIDSQLDDSTYSQSIVLHEIVHYLQDLSGKYGKDCQSWYQNEKEAYAIQNQWLYEQGVFKQAGMGFMRTARCE